MAVTTEMRTEVSQLYVALFGRAPDAEGLGFWVQKLAGGTSLVDIANSMYATDPARSYYPLWMTNSEIVTSFYENVLGRAPDAEGLAYWTAKINAPGATPGSVIVDIIDVVTHYTGTDPAGLESAALFANKVEVAQYFAEQVGTVEGSTEVLIDVTSDPASVTAAIAEIDGTVNQGDTFTLTTSVDGLPAFQGGSANDTFVGFLGGYDIDDNTAQPFDVVDGGAGNDTFVLTMGDSGSTSWSMSDVEDVILKTTAASANDGDWYSLDASSWAGVQNLTIQTNSSDSDGGMSLDALAADLTTLTLSGVDTSTDSSSFEVYINTNGPASLSIQNLVIENLNGDSTLEIEGLTNIPTLYLTNIGHGTESESFELTLEVANSVGTGTDDTLTVVAENAGAMSWDFWTSTEIDLYNADGNGVIENLDITANGDHNSLDFDYTTGLVDVSVVGSGDLALWLDDATQVSDYDASGLAGDLSSSVSSTVDVTVALGSGNDAFYLYVSDTNTADTNFVTADLDTGAGDDFVYTTWQAGDGVVQNINTGDGGDVVVILSTGNAEHIDLGAGNDAFAFGSATLDLTLDTIEGGTGFDFLALTAGQFSAANMAAFSGFEGLLAVGGGTFDLDAEAGLITLVAGASNGTAGPDAWYDPNEPNNYNNRTGNNDVVFSNAYAGVLALVLNDYNNQSTTFSLKTDGAADILALYIGNEETDVSVADAATTEAVFVNDIETLTIISTGNDGNVLNNTGDLVTPTISDNLIGQLSASDMTKLVVTGDSNLTITNLATGAADTDSLTQIDASAFTGNLVFGEASNTASAMQVQLGSGSDVYYGTAFGDTINAGAGADTLTLGAAGETDTLILEAGDSKIGGLDLITGFVSGEDTIDLGAFGFTGTAASAIIAKGDLDPVANYNAGTSITDFFVSAGVQRGVAYATDGVDTHVFVDVNNDGDFTSANDLVIQLTGTATVTLADFGF